MSKVIVGSARVDERGTYSGGKAGDQTGKEVSTQVFYRHKKGWYLLRPKKVSVANGIAKSMLRACNNNNLGYDQGNRLDIAKHGTDSKEKTECDCSSLIRQCIKEASGKDVGNFTTANEAKMLESSGLFENRKSVNTFTKLYEGDVLVTKTQGHTVAVVGGPKRTESGSSKTKKYSKTFSKLPSRGYFEVGDKSIDVGYLQTFLNWAIDAGLKVDSIYGSETKTAVKAFQRKYCLDVDGKFGKKSLAKAKAIKR